MKIEPKWVPKRRQLELRRRGITQKGTNYKVYHISIQANEETQNFKRSNVTHHLQNPTAYYDHGYVRGRSRKSVPVQLKLIFMWVNLTSCYMMEIPNEEFKILPLCKPDLYLFLFAVNVTLMNTVRLTLFFVFMFCWPCISVYVSQ